MHASTRQPEQQPASVPCSTDADLYYSNQTDGNWSYPAVPASQQLRWDAWARLTEPLLASVPSVFVPGNHGARLLYHSVGTFATQDVLRSGRALCRAAAPHPRR